MRIGLFGGTFNPIHNGHIAIAKAFFEEMALDKLLLIPAKTPVHKGHENLASGEDRMAMCGLAASGIPGFIVSDMELSRPEESFTYVTVMAVKKQYPQAEFFLLVGGDMFLSFESWYRYRDMLQQVTLCAAPRREGEREALLFHAQKLTEKGGRCVVLDTPVLMISSTALRELLRENKDLDAYLHPSVRDYIRQKGLYRPWVLRDNMNNM